MVALNKPSGLQVLPGGLFQQRTVLTQLCWSVKKQNSTLNSQETHPVPVHRLGRGTSGRCSSVSYTHYFLLDVDNMSNALYFFMLLLTHASPSKGTSRKGYITFAYSLLFTHADNITKALYFFMLLLERILLCAKTKVAKTRLAAYFADGTSLVGATSNRKAERSGTRKISKIYRALVTGILVDDKVIIDQPIGIVRYPGVAKGLYVASPSGKPALSKVEVLERDEKQNCTLVQVEIESGRPHQIRIHLSFIGHPLLGDPLYIAGGQPRCFDPELVDESFAQDGGYQRPTNPVPGDCGYYLHAHRLVLSHPTTNEMIYITAPLSTFLQTSDEANGSPGSISINSGN
ncbi:hypothetical protein Goshw_012241 [Gossypium schwendimanii]|uniref:Pseudouridine synthase RsuA/RluA-like domain-containing protein n=1 Tax=Gossypium schwendimanii TaxID=34291 RepID=A0A7J9MBM3_GOSSC|nr:hypothetical protein [Gossypium schwendimanii]